jgi:hypothetical protein
MTRCGPRFVAFQGELRSAKALIEWDKAATKLLNAILASDEKRRREINGVPS